MYRLGPESRCAFLDQCLQNTIRQHSNAYEFLKFVFVSKLFLASSRSKNRVYRLVYCQSRGQYSSFRVVPYFNPDMRYYQWVDIDYTYYLKLFAFIKPFLVEIKEENSFDIGKYHEFCDIAAGKIAITIKNSSHIQNILLFINKYASKIVEFNCSLVNFNNSIVLPPIKFESCSLTGFSSIHSVRRFLEGKQIRKLRLDLSVYLDLMEHPENQGMINWNVIELELIAYSEIKFEKLALFTANIQNYFPRVKSLKINASFTEHLNFYGTNFDTSALVSKIEYYYKKYTHFKLILDGLVCEKCVTFKPTLLLCNFKYDEKWVENLKNRINFDAINFTRSIDARGTHDNVMIRFKNSKDNVFNLDVGLCLQSIFAYFDKF